MQVEKPPVDSVWTMSTHSLAGRSLDERTLPGSPKAAIRGNSSKKIRLGHVVTTAPDHERVKANNCPPETARRDDSPP